MKTTTLIALLSILFTLNMNASEYTFKEEAPINDIPFDTKAIFDSLMIEKELASFHFDEEANVDDIPFDTQEISEQGLYQMAITETFEFDEENYIDDIPTPCPQFVRKDGMANQSLSDILNSI